MPATGHATAYVVQETASLLFVDDDPILREFARVNLATDTVEVEVAGDGVAALEALEISRFDAILLDLEMPRMDGFELLSRLRQDDRWRNLPVIVVTGREDIGAVDRAYSAGATTFTVKPLNWRLLSYQVRFVLRAARAEREALLVLDHYNSALTEKSALLQQLALKRDKSTPSLVAKSDEESACLSNRTACEA